MSYELETVPDGLKIFFHSRAYSKSQYANFEVKIVFDYIKIKKLLLGNDWRKLRDLEDMIISVTGQPNSNPRLRFSNIFGDEFSIGVYEERVTKRPDISVWDHAGHESIGHYDATPDDLARMMNDANLYTQGKIHCSACKAEMDIQAARSRRFYAGVYCERCWTEDWVDDKGNKHENMRAVESRESYG